MKPINVYRTERGMAFAAGSSVFHSTDGMPGMGGAELRTTLAHLAEREAPLHVDVIAERIPAKRRELFAGAVMPVVGAAIDAARRAKSETLAADARQREPVLSIDPVLAVETRSSVRPLSPTAQHAWVESADLAGLTVVASDGNPANLEPPIYERARERYWIENWIARNNAESGHPAQPSVETVLATGPDAAAVRAEAEEYYSQHLARLDAIDEMESSAKSLVAFMAALFDLSAQEVLDMATGRADAEAA